MTATHSHSLSPSDSSSSANAALAAYLSDHAPAIIEDWSEHSRPDPGLPVDDMGPDQSCEHLPFLFDSLIQHLRTHRAPPLPDRATAHGGARHSQGFYLADLIHEIARLRSALIRSLLEFDDLNPHLGQAERLLLHHTVHDYLDNLIVDAAVALGQSQKRI